VHSAGGGIGRASATLFAREGAKVMCSDINKAAAMETAKSINDAAGCIVAIAAEVNVANAADVANMIAVTEKTFGKVDCLFNNAGLMHSNDDK
jgi:NAD(P)-dependent dehydrogenase (short-subunit alcohol dehydrogenase family)